MATFYEWLGQLDLLNRLRLLETYVTFDAAQYNQLFANELEKLLQRVSVPAHRQVLERMRNFNWIGYIAASARNAGFREYRARQEATADVASKLLMGTLFRGFDERTSGPMDLRVKQSIANALRNIIEKERNRRRNLPTASTAEYEPSAPSPIHDDEKVIEDFRKLLHSRLGDLALAVFDLRMRGGETKSLVGYPAVGSPSRFAIKEIVKKIKSLAGEYATALGDPGLLRDIQRAMQRETETLQKRFGKRVS
jgi:hypothetical protein